MPCWRTAFGIFHTVTSFVCFGKQKLQEPVRPQLWVIKHDALNQVWYTLPHPTSACGPIGRQPSQGWDPPPEFPAPVRHRHRRRCATPLCCWHIAGVQCPHRRHNGISCPLPPPRAVPNNTQKKTHARRRSCLRRALRVLRAQRRAKRGRDSQGLS
eukprot:gene12011-biopygen3398